MELHDSTPYYVFKYFFLFCCINIEWYFPHAKNQSENVISGTSTINCFHSINNFYPKLSLNMLDAKEMFSILFYFAWSYELKIIWVQFKLCSKKGSKALKVYKILNKCDYIVEYVHCEANTAQRQHDHTILDVY